LAIDPAVSAVRQLSPWSGHREARIVAIAAVVAVLTGAMIGRGLAIQVVVLAGLIACFLLGLADWRRSIYGLLAYLPYSGIAGVLLYPRTAPAVLAKDFLFVVPAYVGFLAQHVIARRSMSFRGAPTWLFAAFAVLVLAQAFNPALPGGVVAAIGAKVWLFYIPLCFLGYHMVRDRRDLHRILGVMSLAAVLPALVGVGEALLIYAGNGALVYKAYGQAAASVTQDFAEFELAGGAILRRVPSTFAFVAQYFAFTVSMVAVTYAWWRGTLTRTPLAMLGMGVWLLLLLASFLSGARAAFLFVPFLVIVILILEGPRARLRLLRIMAPVLVLLCVAVVILGSSAGAVLMHAWETGFGEFGVVFVDGFRRGFALTLTGLGTGIDTNAARYAFTQAHQFSAVNGFWYESWYVKVLLELGVAGLIIVALLLGTLLTAAFRQHVRLRDPGFRAISASVLALLIWNAVFNMKAQYMDIDPMNVHLWLLLGLLFKLPELDAAGLSTAMRPEEGN
jgi:hypothetical protein